MGLIIRLLICVIFACFLLYREIDKRNELTEIQLLIPALTKEVNEIQEKNLELEYEIESFQSPLHLMELIRRPEFGHLKFTSLDEEIFLPEATPPMLK